MGSDIDKQRAAIFYKNHRDSYEEKLLKIIHVAGIPVLWLKVNKYTKTYYLFNLFPIFSETTY